MRRLTLEALIIDTVQDQSCPPGDAVPAPIKGLLSELICTTKEMPPSKIQITLCIGRMLETGRPPKDVGLWSQHDKMSLPAGAGGTGYDNSQEREEEDRVDLT